MQNNMSQPSDSTLSSNDYHVLPASQKQIVYAQQLARRAKVELPPDALTDRRQISNWIDQHKAKVAVPITQFSNYPSSKQVAFAEHIARSKRDVVPHDCFRDRVKMSRWIDRHL